jgi:hypothetical protein
MVKTATEYVVDHIVKHRVNKSTKDIEYLVHWKDFGEKDQTWEPVASLANCNHLLSVYKSKLLVDRVVDDRVSSTTGVVEYLIKWEHLPPSENTWAPKVVVRKQCPDKVKAYLKRKRDKRYREKNKGKRRAIREENKEIFNAKAKAYREQNRESINANAEAYREQNREIINANAKACREQNKARKQQHKQDRERAAESSWPMHPDGTPTITPELLQLCLKGYQEATKASNIDLQTCAVGFWHFSMSLLCSNCK